MAEITADLILNTKILLRRAEFDDACVLAIGEPGYHTTTHELKIGDGSTAWKDLPFANEEQIRTILSDYKTKQSVINAVQTDPNVFVDTVAQDANGVITLTTKAVDFSDYRTAADQDLIDATFKTKQDVINANGGSDTRTITAIRQNENGEIDVTFSDIDFPPQVNYTVSCADEEVAATETTAAFKRHTLTQNGQTVCTIDIPRDLVIKSGSVDKNTNELVLVLVNDEEIRVDVSHLIEYVTGATATDGVITIDISDDFVATATINDGTITAAKFAEDVDTYVDGRIDDKINELDVQDITGFGAGKTLATLTETDGKISATFQDIAITAEQVTDLSTKYKQVQAAVVDPTTDGTAVSFIDTISQDAQGKITVTKKTVDFSDINTELNKKIESVTIDSPADYQVQLTVDGVKGEAVEVQGIAALAERIGDIEDSYVSKVTGGTDIVVTPVDGTGEVTVSHAEHASGLYQAIGHNTIEDPSFFTGIQLDNGHMDPTKSTVINLRNALDKKTSEDDTTHGNILIDLLKSMTIVLDGGTLKIG